MIGKYFERKQMQPLSQNFGANYRSSTN